MLKTPKNSNPSLSKNLSINGNNHENTVEQQSDLCRDAFPNFLRDNDDNDADNFDDNYDEFEDEDEDDYDEDNEEGVDDNDDNEIEDDRDIEDIETEDESEEDSVDIGKNDNKGNAQSEVPLLFFLIS